MVRFLEDLLDLLLQLVFFEGSSQGVELLRGQVVYVILVAVQEVHNPAKHAPHFVENIGVLGGVGNHRGMLKSSGDGQLGGLGVVKEITITFSLNSGLPMSLRFDGFSAETQASGQLLSRARPFLGQSG
jgi:hypothetical protein